MLFRLSCISCLLVCCFIVFEVKAQIGSFGGFNTNILTQKKEFVFTKWRKGKLDPNCQYKDPEDCMIRHLVKTLVKSATYYVVTDSSINKQFKITKIPIMVLEQIGGISAWAEVLCEKDMNATIIKNVNSKLIELGYLDESLLKDAGTLGKVTKNAIIDYQIANGLPIGGALNIPLLGHLGLH